MRDGAAQTCPWSVIVVRATLTGGWATQVHTRAIVYPQGLPVRSDARTHCEQLVLLCGGDPHRQFERQGGTLVDFTRYIARLPAFRLGQVEVLGVFTQTQPFSLILPTRRTLEKDLPVLSRGAWLIFWDHETHPALPHHLTNWGHLDGLIDRAPVWRASTGEMFLIVSTRTSLETMKVRLRELRQEAAVTSGVRSSQTGRRDGKAEAS
jgi:hypothetical protein